MKSLRSLISWSAFVLMAGLLVFSALVYAASEILLQRFVDGRLLVLAETLAEFVERHPEFFEQSGKDIAPTNELTRSITEPHVLADVTHALRVKLHVADALHAHRQQVAALLVEAAEFPQAAIEPAAIRLAQPIFVLLHPRMDVRAADFLFALDQPLDLEGQLPI